ncbi:MAG: radical SAM protein [Elusimicrobia bacterium]|nr:radical SAM protein [Elusimicrobiota bacterium]MBU2614145.1 radical SAM protein [Elusimicrobiota bacterium]
MLTRYNLQNAKTILNKSEPDDEDPFIGTVNPYTGCEHRCQYCYVQSEKYQPYKNKADFFYTIGIKQNAQSLLEEQFSKGLPYGMISIGSSSDPYQPAEKEHKITRKILETTNKFGYPVNIFTKSDMIMRDLDLLKSIADKSFAVVSVSMITLDVKTCEIFEQAAPPTQKRLEMMKELNKNGIVTGCSLMPVLPYITDSAENLDKLIEGVKKHGGRYVWEGCLTLRDNQYKKYREVLLKDYPGLLQKYNKLYGSRISPSYDYRNNLHKTINGLIKKYGLHSGLSFITKDKRWGKGLTPVQLDLI